MRSIDDSSYLRNEQYRDGGNLSARVALHRRFSVNQTGWFPWVFDRIAAPDDARILDLGCGTGEFWLQNRGRIPQGWDLTLSDLSSGMVRETRTRLGEAGVAARWCVADAQALPFPDATFDAVLAAHMLYHVPDRGRAFAEIRRVLLPGGLLVATTVGIGHLRELDALASRLSPETAMDDVADRFGLENGAGQLRPWFADVEREDYPDALEVTEVEPVVAYLMSMTLDVSVDDARVAGLREELAEIIARDGAFRVTKTSGLFRCRAFS